MFTGDCHCDQQVTAGFRCAPTSEGDVDAGEDGQAPPEVDQQPTAALTLTALEDGRGDDAATQEQQHRRSR